MVKRILILCALIGAASVAFAQDDAAHIYKLSDTDNLYITPGDLASYQQSYEITRQKIVGDKSVPVPLQMEEYDESHTLQTVGGVVVAATDEPAFDTTTGKLTYANKDESMASYAYEYKLVDNTFKLLKETKTQFSNCDEKTGICTKTVKTQ